MARQKGIITIEGTLTGINFYVLKGVPVARKAGGGFNGKAIKTQPNMARVRENSSEFGHCSRVKKLLKDALDPFLMHYQDVSLHGRMMRMLTQIKDLDLISERGKRNVGQGLLHAAGKNILKNFVFTPQQSISHVMGKKGNFDRNDYTYRCTNVALQKSAFPSAATHAALTLGVLVFDFETLTPHLFLSETQMMEPGFQTASLVLQPKQLTSPNGMQMVFLGLTFYQEINGIKHVLKEQKNTGLEVVAVL